MVLSLGLGSAPTSQGALLYAHFWSAASGPVTSAGYTAGGHTVEFSLGFPPVPGTVLTVVNNTELAFITGKFSNLAQGQRVSVSYGGQFYPCLLSTSDAADHPTRVYTVGRWALHTSINNT